MMPANYRTLYVMLYRRWLTRGGRWETGYAAHEERPGPKPDLIAVFETRASSRKEACAVVAEFLYRGKPAAMDVKEITL